MEKACLDCLPREVVLSILSRLPKKDIARCKCVCRSLLNLISTSLPPKPTTFICLQPLPQQPWKIIRFHDKGPPTVAADDDDLTSTTPARDHENWEILASCEGALLCRSIERRLLCVCNPKTRQELMIERQPLDEGEQHLVTGLAAYDGGRSFDVVSVCCSRGKAATFDVFSSGSGVWRRSRDTIPPAAAERLCRDSSTGRCVFPKGVIRWSFTTFMLVYRIDSGTHRLVRQPPFPKSLDGILIGRLFVSRGQLMNCLIQWERFRIWVREEEDDDVSEPTWELKIEVRLGPLVREHPHIFASAPSGPLIFLESKKIERFLQMEQCPKDLVDEDAIYPLVSHTVYPIAVVDEPHCIYMSTAFDKILSYNI